MKFYFRNLSYKEYTANLSSYSGQKGYIAIRHFNCRSEFKLLLDDFGIYGENETPWNTIDNPDPTGTVIDDLKPNTLYEYEVYYTNDGIHFYTSSVSMTTPHDDLIPTKLVASNVTSNTATISWAGYADSYNLRYRNFTGEKAIVTLCVPQQVWFDDSGYQMLLDDGHDTYGSLIPEEGSLIPYGQSPTPELYARFHYKIPENADADLSTTYIVDGVKTKTETIEIPAGVYDWCIVNPIPNQCLWIVSGDVGNIEGRMDDFIFEAGTPYIIKWDKASDYVDDDAHNIVNPVFSGVTISNTANDVVSTDEKVSFKGTYAYQYFTRHNNSILFLGAANTLYYPSDGASIGAQRAYFQLSDLDAYVKDFNLNFGDDEATDAVAPLTNGSVAGKTSWYDLSGRKLNGEPTSKGIYINNGKKKYVK